MSYYMSKEEIKQEILIGIRELRGFKINSPEKWDNPMFLDGLSEEELKKIYNEVSDKLREMEERYK